MASQNNLNAVFTDIANSIRSKKGSVDTMKPINMADEILTISGVKNFITTRNANRLFYDCSSLTDEQLASILKYDDTSGATDMTYMFYGCSKLTTIPLINTSSCTTMTYMFQNCSKLTTIPQLDTSSCTGMDYMLYNCYSLTSIPQLDTSKVKYMYQMFYGCSKLTTMPLLDTSNATNMNNMFYSCSRLEKIDITKLASKNSACAYSCYSLKTLIIRTMDTIPALASNAFTNCYHFYGTTDSTYNPNGLKDGRIYVPDDKVESLKTATNWSVFADIIKPLSEYVE